MLLWLLGAMAVTAAGETAAFLTDAPLRVVAIVVVVVVDVFALWRIGIHHNLRRRKAARGQ